MFSKGVFKIAYNSIICERKKLEEVMQEKKERIGGWINKILGRQSSKASERIPLLSGVYSS